MVENIFYYSTDDYEDDNYLPTYIKNVSINKETNKMDVAYYTANGNEETRSYKYKTKKGKNFVIFGKHRLYENFSGDVELT